MLLFSVALFGAVATASANVPASSTPTAVSASVEGAKVEAATRLIGIINPLDRLLAQEMRGWELGMRHRLAADDSIARLEKEFPGAIGAALVAARPVAEVYVTDMLLKVQQHKIETMANALTLQEIREVETFFRSPTGAKLARGMTEPQQAEHLIKRMTAKAEDDRTITEKDANAATGDAVKSVMADASSTDLVAVMRFESSPAGRKLRGLVEENQRYALTLVNEPNPAFVERQDKTLSDAIIAFVERAAKK